jgi:hypothetical protein
MKKLVLWSVLFLFALKASTETALVPVSPEPKIATKVSWFATEPAETGMEIAVVASPDMILAGIDLAATSAIYQFINSIKYPTILVLGTEGAAMIQVGCTSGKPFECLAKVVRPENLYNALNMVSGGVTYALGEKIEKTIHEEWQLTFQQAPSLMLARSALTTLAAGGMSYIVLSSQMEESIEKNMLASLFSGIALAALNNTVTNPAFEAIKNRITQTLGTVTQKIGVPVAVVTAVTGTAAIAYATDSRTEVLNVLNQAKNYLPSVGKVREMIRTNYLWMQGYRGAQKALGMFVRST